MSNFIPRLRGKVGVAEGNNDPKVDGKFFFHIWLCHLSGEPVGDPFGPFGPFETEKIAKAELKRVSKDISQMIEKRETGTVSGRYMDFTQVGAPLRSWEEN